MNAKLFCWLVASVMSVLLAASVQAQNKALDPIDRKDDWWVKRHAENVEQMSKGDIELLLIGDSITHAWGNHKELYEKFFGEYKPINLGFSGDQTAHVLWRLDHLPLDKISPKVAMIMIGTNNIGHRDGSTPKEAAEGIVAIVRKLQTQYPRLKIIVLKVFPRDEKPDGEYRKKVNEINTALPAMLSRIPNVRLVDINAGFLDKDGILPKDIMGDFLHPGKEGYEYWGQTIAPVIKSTFRQYDRQNNDRQNRRTPPGTRLRALFR
jgi:lysophospholipase L1-like esterase